jgi:hypothetical protein
MVMIPAKTVGDGSDESISEGKFFPLSRFSETQLRDTLSRWVFPRLEGTEIDLVDDGKGGV